MSNSLCASDYYRAIDAKPTEFEQYRLKKMIAKMRIKRSMEHGVLLHPHKGRVMVRFGVTVTVPAYIELIDIILHPLQVFPGLFDIPLQGRFPLSGPAYKYDPFFAAELFQL